MTKTPSDETTKPAIVASLVARIKELERAADSHQYDLQRVSVLKEVLRDAPHGALCKRGLGGLYDKERPCTCWKKGLEVLLK